ncbi:hypothetical protein MAC_07069 [Metarhizium acridum CQMa 102]|uniref:Uncharacterized protein n=1 Tax=Metarhizium acridum (strain CQMa 102) TaxID=655827 RepID=E9EB21_METAQ|nr:uncharacterized protein MAC_07069 [Metarhizium acridum CQMa 102]EFY86853.1 hypothetical protein MAC_07069 [Metarhizium acridum CQMa 102]
MKVSSAFVLTLLTGALAAPSVVSDFDSEKRDVDVAARDFDDSVIANAVEARQVDTTITLDERDVEVEDVEIVARTPGQGAKKAGANTAAKKKAGANTAAKKKNNGAKANKNKASKAKAAAARVTNSFQAPGVV